MCQRLSFGVTVDTGRVHLPFPLACWIVGQPLARKSGRSRHLTAGEYMSDPREGKEFFLNVPEKLEQSIPRPQVFPRTPNGLPWVSGRDHLAALPVSSP